MKNVNTALEFVDVMPPCICKAFARRGHGRSPVTDWKISQRSGLSLRFVISLGRRNTWAGVPPEKIDAYMKACGMTFNRTHIARQWRLLDAGKLSWMSKNRSEYLKLFVLAANGE